jgi:hypothetical protein
MAPTPEAPGVVHDVDEESILLLQQLNPKCYSDLIAVENYDETQTERTYRYEESYARRSLHDLWLAYYYALEKRPLLVKSITALMLMGCADLIAQLFENLRGISRVSGVNCLRCMRFATFGLIGAPWTHYYYHWLDTALPPTEHPCTLTTAGKFFLWRFERLAHRFAARNQRGCSNMSIS